jgi:hypothetical protein
MPPHVTLIIWKEHGIALGGSTKKCTTSNYYDHSTMQGSKIYYKFEFRKKLNNNKIKNLLFYKVYQKILRKWSSISSYKLFIDVEVAKIEKVVTYNQQSWYNTSKMYNYQNIYFFTFFLDKDLNSIIKQIFN